MQPGRLNMKTFIQFGSQKNHVTIFTITIIVRYEVLGSHQRFLSFADKETAKEIILAMDEKDFPCSIFSTLSHGQVHRGCQMQFRYYIANFIKAIVFFNRKKNHGISQRPFEDQRIRALVKPG